MYKEILENIYNQIWLILREKSSCVLKDSFFVRFVCSGIIIQQKKNEMSFSSNSIMWKIPLFIQGIKQKTIYNSILARLFCCINIICYVIRKIMFLYTNYTDYPKESLFFLYFIRNYRY